MTPQELLKSFRSIEALSEYSLEWAWVPPKNTRYDGYVIAALDGIYEIFVLTMKCGTWFPAHGKTLVLQRLLHQLGGETVTAGQSMLRITTRHPASKHGVPVIVFHDHDVSHPRGITLVLEFVGWSLADLVEATGKKMSTVKKYSSGDRQVPAEVLNVLKDKLEGYGVSASLPTTTNVS